MKNYVQKLSYLSVATFSWSASFRASHKATSARKAGGSTFTTDDDGPGKYT